MQAVGNKHVRGSNGSPGMEHFISYISSLLHIKPLSPTPAIPFQWQPENPLPCSGHAKLRPSVAPVMMMAEGPSKALKAISLTLVGPD